jgi:hypothetical protein
VQPLTEEELESFYIVFGGVQPDGRLFPIIRQQVWRIVQKHCLTAGIPLAAATRTARSIRRAEQYWPRRAALKSCSGTQATAASRVPPHT